MKLKSPRSRSTYLALATATVWVHCRIDPDNPLSDADRIAAFELAIDRTKLSRESATTLARKGEKSRVPINKDDIVELRCTVQYGPVYGCCQQDFEKSMYTIEDALAKVEHFNHVMSDATYDFDRRSLTLADLKAQIDVLTARINGDTLTAAARESAERRLAQCRIYLEDAGESISLIDGSQPAKPAEQLQPQTDERPQPSSISAQEICFGPPPAQQPPQPVDSNRVEDAASGCTSSSAPGPIDNSLNTKELIDEEQVPEEALPELRPAGGDDYPFNDIFRSNRDADRERRDADG